MDILKKMFGKIDKEGQTTGDFKDEFRKPSWFDDNETDDELFDNNQREFMFQIFTNPLEMQKHFDKQLQDMLKTFRNQEDGISTFDENPRDEYLKPGFEEQMMKKFQKPSTSLDSDLDGEIYAGQLNSLLQRLSPDLKTILPDGKKNANANARHIKPKFTDEEIIMNRIHGTHDDETQLPKPQRKEVFVPKMSPHFGGIFEGTYQGPKMFGQSIISQTIRKPDGTFETKRIIRDSKGNTKTTITRSVDGKTETITTYGDGTSTTTKDSENIANAKIPAAERNIFVSKNGYALPKNIW